jgi:acyl-coenzyme A thioesterase PaaI-like protein
MTDVDRDAINEMLAGEWGDRVRCLDVTPQDARVQVRLQPYDIRPGDYIAGPAQFEAADLALYVLTFGALGRVEPMALTSELSIRFLRPAIGRRLHAAATLDRAGRRILVGTVRVWADDDEHRPSAVAQGSYAIPDRP